MGAMGCERDRLLVLAGQHLGLRISELLSLRVKAVATGFTPKAEVSVPRKRLKGGRSGRSGLHGRSIPVHPDLAVAIERYLANYPGGSPGPDSFLFPSRKGYNRPISHRHAWRVMKEAAASAGINADRVSTHSLRKSFARDIYEASGHDIRATQALLGHTEVETTVKYIEPDQARLKDLVLGLPSKGAPVSLFGHKLIPARAPVAPLRLTP